MRPPADSHRGAVPPASLPQLPPLPQAPAAPPWDNPKVARQALEGFACLCRHCTIFHDADRADAVTHFHSVSEPGVSLPQYAASIHRATGCGDDALLVALVLVGRACGPAAQGEPLLPSLLTAHRLLLAGLRIATKVLHDVFRSNRTFARAGGVALEELNVLEAMFLRRIRFRAVVAADEVEGLAFRAQLAPPDRAVRHIAAGIGLPLPDAPSPRAPRQRHGRSSPASPVGGARVAIRLLRAGSGAAPPTPLSHSASASFVPSDAGAGSLLSLPP